MKPLNLISQETPQGYYDANEQASFDVTDRLQNLEVQRGPNINGLPTYSGPHFPRLHSNDPKQILNSGELDSELDYKIQQLVENANRHGLDVQVHEGYRTPEAQDRAKAEGHSKLAGGQSLHQKGLAADLVFNDTRGQPSWSEEHDWQILGKLGKELGLEWGGDWHNPNDRPHFQVPTQKRK